MTPNNTNSWNGFVKAVNRATTSVLQSTGAAEKTVCLFISLIICLSDYVVRVE